MKALDLYKINLFSLSNKSHQFDFKIEDTFFSCFEDSLIEKGELQVIAILDKSETMIQCTFHIKGAVVLTCDRSLENFDFSIDSEEKIIYKYADEYEEVSEDLIHIPHKRQQLNIAQALYELISIQVPMKKIHPKFVTENEDEFDDEEEDELIYSSNPIELEEDIEAESNNDKDIDPRWKDLLNLKSKK